MKHRKRIIMLAASLLSAFSLLQAQQRKPLATDCIGYYKDVFMDSGINLTSRTDLPATRYLGLSLESFISASHSPMELTIMDTIIQQEMICGNPYDANGVLLYPDGAPRFRVIYMNGGKATKHGNSLTAKGRENIRKFIENGGSYVGTCAGMFIASNGVYKDDQEYEPNGAYTSIWPGTCHGSGLYDNYTAMEVIKDSPLLDYFDFGGDRRIDSLWHNGGGYAYYGQGGIIPEGTEPLLKYVYDTVGKDERARQIHGQVSAWAYKKDSSTGRIVLTGSHPEGVVSGDRLEYRSAMLLYAIDGNAAPKVKGELTPGELRQMNKETDDKDPDFTAVGDLQYHHFTVMIPQGTKRAVVILDGYKGKDGFDLSICAKAGEFAFHQNTDLKNVSTGCSKTLLIENPQPGLWYLSVRCENVPTAVSGKYGTEYISGREVLNGVPYSIKIELEK